jgi:hypothetical protein
MGKKNKKKNKKVNPIQQKKIVENISTAPVISTNEIKKEEIIKENKTKDIKKKENKEKKESRLIRKLKETGSELK